MKSKAAACAMLLAASLRKGYIPCGERMLRRIDFSIALLLTFSAGCSSPEEVRPSPWYPHIRPAWSPNGASVAFTATIGGQSGIWLVDSYGANVRLFHGGDAIGAAWSHDGQWIAFSQGNQIYARRTSGDSLRLIVAHGGSNRPSWSADDSRLAFVRITENDEPDVYMVSLADLSQSLVATGANYPSWTTTASELFYVQRQTNGSVNGDIYWLTIRNVDSLSEQTIHSFISMYEHAFFQLAPDRSAVYYEHAVVDQTWQIYRTHFATSSTIPLTYDGGDFPALSPDGTKIVYTRTASGDGGLWVMNTDGTNKRRLTTP